jgi:hypothetical protein
VSEKAMSNTQKPSANPDGTPDELLGDLESIRELLDEEAAAAAAEGRDLTQSDAVPLLDDMVRGAYELHETSVLLAATPVLGGDGQRSRYLREDVFEALLGDRWKASASDILTEARGAIEAHRNQWTPDDTDELNEALRVRIDETLTQWLKAVVSERLDELHAVILRVAESVIDEKIRTLTAPRPASSDNPTD